ncbi:MAG: hypothetical protein L0Z53_16210, partial [Acidobacteriales bacterium]|nr:hypothetical protein [Terriglobales bacterium]
PRAGKWPNLLDATIPGVPDAQVARVIGSYGGRDERIAIAFHMPGQSLDPPTILTAVGAQLNDFQLGYVDCNQGDVARLWVADSSSPELVFLIAAAAAVLKRSWGWDESPSIIVSLGDQSFRFQVQYSGDERSHDAVELTAA